jgi:hypothetical protein
MARETDRIPSARRAQAYRLNDEGWAERMKFIERHFAEAAERWPAAPR